MKRFETLDYSNLDELITFFDDLSELSQMKVSFDHMRIVEEFNAHGFIAGANCGDACDKNNRENVAVWLIGQALECLQLGGWNA